MPAKYTIEFNSRGNHGHQLKDFFGGLTIGEILEMEFVCTPYNYLKNFGVGLNAPSVPRWQRRFRYKKVEKISGPTWNGFHSFENLKSEVLHRIDPHNDETLYVFEKALRVHPFQAIDWFSNSKINTNVFENVVNVVSSNYKRIQGGGYRSKYHPDIAIHINRGIDFDQEKYPEHFENSRNVRYIFPLDYYENIILQLLSRYSSSKPNITIYTERLHSEEIIQRFENREYVTIKIGHNRTQKNTIESENIFRHFVNCDILVTCNSSFSTVASYYRPNKTTIYHPHLHLDHMPSPHYLSTNVKGEFETSQLPEFI